MVASSGYLLRTVRSEMSFAVWASRDESTSPRLGQCGSAVSRMKSDCIRSTAATTSSFSIWWIEQVE
eukprot:scaffold141868_cov28-Tisochrysis_lutea.AAC.2